MKDEKWFRVKPNPKALIVNIGDLFQVIPSHQSSAYIYVLVVLKLYFFIEL